MKQFILISLLLVLSACGEQDFHGQYQLPGVAGKDGRDGKDGDTGSRGDNGATGAAGAQGPIGATGAQGLQGVAGNTGSQGVQGEPGPQGQKGATGAVGPAGTSTTIVQLCGSCVAQYPSTFPEIGICIGNKLYGVYSANGGFMIEIVPGVYSSNGINCSCSFIVAANCAVTS